MLSAAALGLILTQAQVNALNMAYNYGSFYGLAKTFQAVVLVESSGCLHESGDKGASLGCSQIQVYTARQTCGCEVTERDLLDNKQRNLSIGAHFLARCFNQFWPDRKRALYCYSAGIPAASKATDSEIAISASKELGRDDPRWKPHYIWRVESAVRALEGVKQNHE